MDQDKHMLIMRLVEIETMLAMTANRIIELKEAMSRNFAEEAAKARYKSTYPKKRMGRPKGSKNKKAE